MLVFINTQSYYILTNKGISTSLKFCNADKHTRVKIHL